MQLIQNGILTEIIYILKHIIVGVLLYLIVSRKNTGIKTNYLEKLRLKDFLTFVIPFTLVMSLCNLIIPDHLIFILYFLFLFIYCQIKMRAKRVFLSNSIIAITVDFIVIIMQWISSFIATGACFVYIKIVNATYFNLDIVTMLSNVVLLMFVLLIVKKPVFNPTIIRKMMKHKAMKVSQVLAWVLAITLSVTNKYLEGQEYTLRLHIFFAFLFIIYGVIAVYYYNREKGIERFKTTLREANDAFYMEAALAHKNGYIEEDIEIPPYVPKPGHENEPEIESDEYDRKMAARCKYFKSEYENALVKTDFFLDSSKLKYGTNRYLYLDLAIYFSYHFIRTDRFYNSDGKYMDPKRKEILNINYILEQIVYYYNLHNNKKIDEPKVLFYIRCAIRDSITRVTRPENKAKFLPIIDDENRTVDFIELYVFAHAHLYIEDRYNIMNKNPDSSPSLY